MSRTDDVRKFLAATDRHCPDTLGVPDDAAIRLQLQMTLEECLELIDSALAPFEEDDNAREYHRACSFIRDAIQARQVDVKLSAWADATIDMDYLNEANRLMLGIEGGPLWDEVHAANMRKIGGPRRADGKLLKPDDWRGPDIDGVLERQREGVTIIQVKDWT